MGYLTLRDEGVYCETIEKSRFIAYAKPVSCREEAESYISEIRDKHKDASHNVPVIIIGEKQK